MSLFRLDDRIAVVTGACGRLGPVWVGALAEAGAKVACLDLDGVKPPQSLRDLLDRKDGNVILEAADVTDRKSLQRAAAAVEKKLGPVSVLVNNAGVDQPPGNVTTWPLEEIPAEVSRRILEVNVLGLFQATQAFVPSLRSAGGGSVICIGSLYGHVSPDQRFYDHLPLDPPFLKPPMYGASKAAVGGLTRYLATHLAKDGIRVNTLVPGGVIGGQDEEFKRKFCERVPLGRMARYEDLIGPLLFLASDSSSYVTGQDLLVDGGFSAW